MSKELEWLQELVDELNTTNGANDKMDILKKYPQCKELLVLVHSTFLQYHVTSKTIKKNKNLDAIKGYFRIVALLNDLSSGDISGHEAIGCIKGFIEDNKEHEELIYKIIDKDLETRLGNTQINKVWKNLIPTFDVALAKSYYDVKDKIDLSKGKYYSSHKLDGCRCITIIKNGKINFYSRQGKEFLTLDVLKDWLYINDLEGMVLDGEICILDDDGKENFPAVMSEIRKKNHTIKNPAYKVFDILTLKDFSLKRSNTTLMERHKEFRNKVKKNKHVSILKQTQVTYEGEIETLMDNAVKLGWEGLILRKNDVYKGKRSNDILKVKKFYDAEYKVIKTIDGTIDDGSGNKVNGLSAVEIEHKGNIVKVGSGFTFKERIKYFNNPKEIIGKVITVKYFEETTNKKNDSISLRFPTLKAIHGSKRET